MTTAATAPPSRRKNRRASVLAVVVAFAVLIALFAVGLVRRLNEHATAARVAHNSAALPALAVTPAVSEGWTRELRVPGDLVAVTQTMVYARASGYVRKWYSDIGAHVQAGDTLAELDTPDLDQQLAQARASLSQKVAALKQAQANSDYLQVTAQRQDTLARQKLVAQQDADQANAQAAVGVATVAAAKADMAAQQATVRQLEQLVAYGRVLAPFAGIVTQRLIDVGSLVNAGAAQGGALFQLQATDPLRVFIQVPQTYAPSVHVGAEARVEVRQYPGRAFSGKVGRTAGALDPTTRTLTTEIEVPNPAGELLPGMYADVRLPVAVSHRVVRIPSSAVVYDATGVHVAVVDAASTAHLVTVQPGRDNGTEVEIVDGLSGGEMVIVSPPAGLSNGTRVQATPVATGDAGQEDGG
ncbi:MAG TPA: efflux RND transporter periplasmic adaptor subunit [Polyangiaceae bacterium]|nr:efflux RND transporter periplasmic adaptor subunit [Polyangiaceae bacterium]